MTRRSLIASALLAGCSRKLAPRYAGWLFVASAEQRGVVVADLSEFRRMTTIPLSQVPDQMVVSGRRLFVTCPLAHSIVAVDPDNMRVEWRMGTPGRIAAMAMVPGTGAMAVLTQQPNLFLLVDPQTAKITKRTQLPETPLGMDVKASMAAIAGPASITRVTIPAARIAGVSAAGGDCGPLRFGSRGATILAGLATKEIVSLDAATGTLLARMPLSFKPARFCFNNNEGQMFVTGTEGDIIAIVNPFQNQVDQTIIGGATPFGMAVGSAKSQNLLFVTNPASGNLTIFDIETRALASSIHVGGNPGEVLLTSGGEYALVIGRDSGDVAVVRPTSVLDSSVLNKDIRLQPLFTVFATGGNPQSAVIVPKAI